MSSSVKAAERPGCAAPARLLVLSYHFPPDGAVGGLRWAGLSKQLTRRGWEVHVLTAAIDAAASAPARVVVHACPRRRTLNDSYRARVRARAAVAGPRVFDAREVTNDAPAGPSANPLRTLRRQAGCALSFPDEGRGWILRCVRCARKLLREHRFDVVVSSGPPHSAHLAAWLATRGRGVRRYVDMRDPWAEMMSEAWAPEVYPSGWARQGIRWLERVVLRSATGVIANTQEFAALLAAERSRPPVAFVSNGIDSERLPPPRSPDAGYLFVAYVGTLYAGRDLVPVLQALRRFLERHPDVPPDKVRLHIAGGMDEPNRARLLEQLGTLGLEDQATLHGRMPRAEALLLLGRAHLAVVLAQDQKLQVPAKLYEPVGMHVPTLVVTEPGSATAHEAARVGAFAAGVDEIDRISQLLEGLWNGAIPARQPPRATIDYARIADTMAAVLQERMGGEHRNLVELFPARTEH